MGKTIAIVEDNHLLTLVMSKHLTSNGYETISFSSGEDLLESMKNGMIPDLAILDVKLKGKISGTEVCELLPEDLPVIFCTGNSDMDFFKQEPNLKIKGVLIKPINLNQLTDLIALVL